ncbi:MAG: serine hydrolase, partial [Duncaniella sp.]|nr:serine hydrolase [Duncaniella sp.]
MQEIYLLTIPILYLITGCHHTQENTQNDDSTLQSLTDSITKITNEYQGEIGVAAIYNNKDTLVVNNKNIYPMMSVFKMHQAVAICNDFDKRGVSLDSILTFSRGSLDQNTWSPMLKDHQEAEISLPVSELLRYTLTLSDNNASNLMFDKLVNVSTTDSLIATIVPRSSFQIAYTEHDRSLIHI